MNQQTNRSQLYSIIIIFFFWGFVAASNGILIPFCKTYFDLSQFQSQLIDLTFYGGYFIGSLVLFFYSRLSGVELLNRIGLKKGIVYGLVISAIGAVAIIPSVFIGSYGLILSSYFIVALGFSLQQTCAQPYVIALGSHETGAHRLNLAGGINSLGTTIGPIAVSYILFGGINSEAESASLASVSSLYVGVAILFILMALFFGLSKMPAVKNEESVEPGIGALKYPQLVLGMVAIFVYVGVEVTIQSNMGALLKLPEFGAYENSQLAPFISLYWGSLMIGRMVGALAIFTLKNRVKVLLQILVPYTVFALILLINMAHGKEVGGLLIYAIPIALMIVVNFLSQEKQSKAMLLFSLYGMIAMLVGLFTSGKLATFAFISGGLACSVLWPCIFSLAILGLGKHTSQGSAFLIMMILGGAIIPPLQGKLADVSSIGIHASYFVPVLCFAYLVWFAIKTKSVLQKQGLSPDTIKASAH